MITSTPLDVLFIIVSSHTVPWSADNDDNKHRTVRYTPTAGDNF